MELTIDWIIDWLVVHVIKKSLIKFTLFVIVCVYIIYVYTCACVLCVCVCVCVHVYVVYEVTNLYNDMGIT